MPLLHNANEVECHPNIKTPRPNLPLIKVMLLVVTFKLHPLKRTGTHLRDSFMALIILLYTLLQRENKQKLTNK